MIKKLRAAASLTESLSSVRTCSVRVDFPDGVAVLASFLKRCSYVARLSLEFVIIILVLRWFSWAAGGSCVT